MKKKRILAVLLSSAIAFSGMPGNVFAAEDVALEDGFSDGEEITEDVTEESVEDVRESVPEIDQGSEDFTGFSDGESEDFVAEEELEDETDPETQVFVDDKNTVTEDTDQSNIKWKIVDSNEDGMDDTLVISGNGDMENYDGAKYTPWFPYANNISSVIIENGVTSVGMCSFEDFKNLENVSFGNSIKLIGQSAFENCVNIKKVTIPDGVIKINGSAFEGCSSLEKIAIPDTITDIGMRAFYNCKKLTYVKMSKNLVNLGERAFYNCTGLKTIYLPLTLEKIGKRCFFRYISNTEEIYIDAIHYEGTLVDWKKINGFNDSDRWGSLTEEVHYVAHHITKPATCLKSGFEEYWSCNSCGGKAYTDEMCTQKLDSIPVIPALGHDLDDGVITKIPTCIAEGVMTYSCRREGCDYTETKSIPKSQVHVYSQATYEWSKDNLQCTATEVCSLCGYENIEAVDSKMKVIEKATCTKNGTAQYVADFENADFQSKTKEDIIPMLDHNNTEIKYRKEASCEEDGYTGDTYCKDCGKYLSSGDIIDALGHKWNNGVIKTKATCTDSGEKIYTCFRCNNIKSEEIPALGHSWNGGIITKEATCTEDGERTYTCARCNDNKVEEIPATGHKIVIDKMVSATCTKPGKIEGSHCSVCEEVLVEQKTIPATGHSWSEWQVVREATVTNAGEKQRTCTKCGELEKQSIAKIIPASTPTPAPTKAPQPTVASQPTNTPAPTVAPTKPSTITVTKGKTTSVKPDSSWKNVKYSTSNKKVATVDKKGKVKAVAAGTVKITIKSGSKKAVYTIVVPGTTAIKGVKSSVSVKKGKTYTLKPKLSYTESPDKVTYKSSNKKIATVSKKGVIKGKKKGTATITIKSGKVTKKCKVKVK